MVRPAALVGTIKRVTSLHPSTTTNALDVFYWLSAVAVVTPLVTRNTPARIQGPTKLVYAEGAGFWDGHLFGLVCRPHEARNHNFPF